LTSFLADDEIIRRFPITKIIVGSLDPLRDLSYRFTQKLISNEVNVKLTEFTDFPHGFLSFSIPVIGLSEAKIPLEVIRTMILEA
jgi:acetyl esterase/lipase